MWTSALKTHRDGLVACAFLVGFLTCVRTVSAASANGDGGNATPTLVIMTSKEIRVFAPNSTKRSSGVVVHEVVEGAALALNYARRTILWSDHTTELLKTAAFDGQQLTGPARNLTAVGQVTADGLAVDWYTGNVYWTDGELDTVEVAAEGGASRRVLYWTDIDQPRAIALVPMNGILFWSDWGEIPKIERAAMNGDPASRVVVVSDNIYWPNGITVDYARERVYWLDGKHRFIDAMDYDGGRRATLVGENIGHPFALAFFDDRVYWTDWETWSVHTVRVGDNDTRPTKLYHLDTGLMAIHVWDPRYQPPGDESPCGTDNGGCSHLCLLAPASASSPRRYECACPTGVLLGADARTCRDGPSDVLLFAQRTHISQISVDTPDHTAFVVPLRNVRHTIALDFDPVDGYLYWSDDELRAIRRARLDGSDERDVVADVAHSDGVAFDWIARNVYWTDTGLDRIEVARFDGSSRRVVVFEALGEPRAIAVAPVDGWLFWTDWSEDDPKIERASLDGSERIVVVTTDLGWPNGLALDLDASKVYWGDAKNDKIEVANMDGTDRRVVVDDNLPHLFGLTLLGDHLYWTDWLRRSIDRVDKITGKDRQVISEPLPNIMGIKAVHLGPPNGTNACAKANGGCSHLCLNRPSGYRCACEINAELAADGRTCVRPDVFLLFARKDNVGRISVTSGHVELIPVAGSKSPRSLDYEYADERVYWIDGRTHAISRSYLNGSAVQKVLELGSGSAESMAIDWVAHNVYWTNADTQRIEVARLDGSSRKILVWRDLDAPHSIVLDPNAAYIFWSELGDADRITRAAMDGSRRKVIVASAGRARGLALDYERERIFWGDRTYNVIKSALYDGSDVRAVVSHDVADPFGLTLHADRVYWSDPVNKDVESANKVDGSARKKIASYSEPPDDFVVYHSSRQSGWNPCAVGNGGCSHFCFAVPAGGAGGAARATCGCPTHYVPHATSGCVAPKSYILYSHKNAVSRLLPGNLDCPDTVLPIQFKNIRAIEYDPTQAYLYWIDGKHKTIRKTLSDGTSIPVVVQNGGHLCDIALDLLGRALFWSDSESNVINVTRLHDGAVAETVVGDADSRPRQIAVHAARRLLFWIDARASGPRIERARVDGARRRPLWSGVATALAVDADSDAVFWYAKSVFRADLGGRGVRELTATLTSHVVAMTAFGAYLYWIDGEKQQIEYADKSGASARVEAALPQKIQQATDLLVVAPLADDVRAAHRCSAAHAHGKCSHLCVWSVDEPDEVCACVAPLTLQDDGQNCLSQHVCEPDYFTCASPEPNGRECIPAAWRCDGQKDCPDNSDEHDCPRCADDEFRCGSGQCIDRKWVCDGTTHCPDARDEARCCDGSSQFRCPSNDVCVGYDLLCDGWENCADGADESEAICSNPDFRKIDVASSRGRHALYIVVLVGFGTLLLILLLAYVFRVRLAKSDPPPYDRATDPLSPAGARPPSKADAAAKKTRAAAARIRISTLGESLIAGYDRGHVTGASSSTNGSGCYPLETLNPPPSPATTAASTRASSSSSRYRPYKHYRTINRPPPPTPCSTDVCDESDSNYHPRGRYDAQLLPPYEPFPPPYEPFPPPPTPRSHCHTESCPPSPSSRSSTNFSPLPPPPSPVPPHPKGYDS